MLNQTPFPNREDRIDSLRRRVEGLKLASVDYQFTQYLDQVLQKLQQAENSLDKTEKHLEHSYQMYLQRNGLRTQPVPPVPQPVPPVPQSVPPMPQSVPSMPQPVPPMQQMGQPPQAKRTLEYRIGTVFLGVVGVLFILIAFIAFGQQYMNNTLQGILFYILGAAIFAGSELFLRKRLEKFSGFMSGLGIAGLYITTILNYLYLKILPSYAALIITVVITAFFIWYSRRKDSTLMRMICLLGCYSCLVPLGSLDNLWAFAIPALILFALNLTGFLCPVKGKNDVADYVQYICTISFLFYMNHLLYVSGLQTWPLYLLVCACMIPLHLLCLRKSDELNYQILYGVANLFFLGFLWHIGSYEDWMIWGVIGVAAIGALFTFVYRGTKLHFAPYLFAAVYALVAFGMCGNKLAVCLCGMVIFLINRLLAAVYRKFAIVDAVYTVFAVFYVCFMARSGDTRILDYAFACMIVVGAFFARKYKKFHIYTAVSFAWVFLLTEKMYPLICSVLICILAAAMIGGGFIKKEKPVRIYGLCLIIFVALKLVGYDFKEAEYLTRIIVFLIVGLVILGVSFLYIYLEKKQDESQPQPAVNPVQGIQPQATPVNQVQGIQPQATPVNPVQNEQR